MSFRYCWYKRFLHTWKIKKVAFVTICFYVIILSDMNVDKFYSNFAIDNEQNILDILQIFILLRNAIY